MTFIKQTESSSEPIPLRKPPHGSLIQGCNTNQYATNRGGFKATSSGWLKQKHPGERSDLVFIHQKNI